MRKGTRIFLNVLFVLGFLLTIGTLGTSDMQDALGNYYPVERYAGWSILGLLMMVPAVVTGIHFITALIRHTEGENKKVGEEKNFERKVKQYLRDCGVWYVKYWGGGNYTKTGVPDILACVNGTFVGIELKASNGEPSAMQLSTLAKIDAAGGVAVLLYSAQYVTFQHLIDAINFGQTVEAQSIYNNSFRQSWLEALERQCND